MHLALLKSAENQVIVGVVDNSHLFDEFYSKGPITNISSRCQENTFSLNANNANTLVSSILFVVDMLCRHIARIKYLKKLFFNSQSTLGATSWHSEYKRLTYNVPMLLTEDLQCVHNNQVLHVSFSHNGRMFATCSKDGFVHVSHNKLCLSISRVNSVH